MVKINWSSKHQISNNHKSIHQVNTKSLISKINSSSFHQSFDEQKSNCQVSIIFLTIENYLPLYKINNSSPDNFLYIIKFNISDDTNLAFSSVTSTTIDYQSIYFYYI